MTMSVILDMAKDQQTPTTGATLGSESAESTTVTDSSIPSIPAVFPARNRVSVTEAHGRYVAHVKTFVGAHATERFETTIRFDQWAREQDFEHLKYPTVIRASSQTLSVTCSWAEGQPLTWSQLVEADGSWTAPIQCVAKALAELHDGVADDLPPGPNTECIQDQLCRAASFLGFSAYENASRASLDLWHIVQNDRTLESGLRAEYERRRTAGYSTPIHADLRLDQILWNDQGQFATLVDWEEFRTGDPAIDLGSLLGEFLFSEIIENLGKVSSRQEKDSRHLVQGAIQATFSSVRPMAVELLRTYASSRSASGPDRTSVVRSAGIHLLDRTFAHADASSHLSTLMRCTLGLSRVAIVKPSTIVAALEIHSQ